MSPPSSANFARHGWFALALSLLLHGSLVLPFLFLSSRGSTGEDGGSLMIDTRVAAPGTEVHLVLCQPRRAEPSSAQPAETPTAVTPVPAPVVSVEEKSVPASPTRQALPGHEASEEQGPSTGSRTRENGRGSGPAGSGTGNGTTTFFQIAAQGKAIVYVLDRSASMGLNGCLAAAKRELLASLERLPPTAGFQVIAYNRRAEPLRINGQAGLVPATAENKRYAALLLEAIQAEGGTEHLPALRRAVALRPDVIFFLTDADEMKAEQIRAVTSLNQGRSIIHTIELGRASRMHGDLPLHVLAQENRGVYKSVPPGP